MGCPRGRPGRPRRAPGPGDRHRGLRRAPAVPAAVHDRLHPRPPRLVLRPARPGLDDPTPGHHACQPHASHWCWFQYLKLHDPAPHQRSRQRTHRRTPADAPSRPLAGHRGRQAEHGQRARRGGLRQHPPGDPRAGDARRARRWSHERGGTTSGDTQGRRRRPRVRGRAVARRRTWRSVSWPRPSVWQRVSSSPDTVGISAGLLGRRTTSVTPADATVVISSILAIVVLATILPAWRAARTSTVQALPATQATPLVAIASSSHSRAGFPPPACLGLRLVARRPRRAMLTTLSVAVAVCAGVVVLFAQSSLQAERGNPGDPPTPRSRSCTP